ncbi:MAG TPA: GDP-mannose dehydrogenase, partial [Ignisphaera sp.]|nr:GDP-mannose dehydrogenase [Ignisphaera sp.]
MRVRLVVIGLGEVGKALYEITRDTKVFDVYGFDVDHSKTIDSLEDIPKPIDYLHIAIPYSTNFVSSIVEYIDLFRPRATIIHSTVAPGTTRKIHELSKTVVGYSPIRGRHPYLKKHLLFWSKWISVLPSDAIEEVKRHLESLGFRVRIYRGNPESLELAKLWETVYRAIMIAAWQEIHRIAMRFNADIVTIAEFIAEVHQVLRDRPVYYPDHIGGHCLIPNT